jgi:pimeloyl-ACP methyl ester carboxylesterase
MSRVPLRARGRRALLLAVAVLTVLAVVGLTSNTSGAATSRHEAKKSKAPGTLIDSTQVAASGVNGTAYLVKYWSESWPANKPEMVTGLVVVPEGTAPAGGWPVVTWAHGTDGTNNSCAPSLDPATDIPNINNLLAAGWEVTATDYQGEGNHLLGKTAKGILPYLVGVSAARNTLDIVRAAQQMPTADASSNYVVWGWSEGGQAAMFALKIADSYVPALDLKGVLALAPPSQFNSSFLPEDEQSADWPFLILAAGGFNAAYGNAAAPLSQLMTATGKKDVKSLKRLCLDSVFGEGYVQGYNSVFVSPAGSALPAAWQTLANDNDPGQFTSASSAPLLIVSGDQDTTVPYATTAQLANELCALSPAQDLERWLYSGLDHNGIVFSGATINDLTQWTSDRFAGDSSPGFYTPTGGGGHGVTVTNSCS